MVVVMAVLMKAVRKINECLLEQAAESRQSPYKGCKTKNTDVPSR